MTPLDRPLPLLPRERNYDWGTFDFIPRLCGRAPGDRPVAELWFGAHPDAPARVVLPGGADAVPGEHGETVSLDRLIAERPREVLGCGTSLPFLTKVLSAAQPLSIQAHPDREEAGRGFAARTIADPDGADDADDAEKVDDAAGRNAWRDANHKPELLYALTPFSALAGFRPAAEAACLLASLGLEELAQHVDGLRAGPDAFRPLLAHLTGRAGTDFARRAADAARRPAAVEAVGALRQQHPNRQDPDQHDPDRQGTAESEQERRDALACIGRLARHHPDDPLVIAPLLLRLVRLEAGEALFIGAGAPHSYLEGSGLEVMASSDNVLRLGLTSKPVDADALLDILVYEAGAPPILQPDASPGPPQFPGRRTGFTPPVDDFRLDVLELEGDEAAPLPSTNRVRIALVLAGEVALRTGAGSARAGAGQAMLLTAAAGPATAFGKGTVAVTSPGAPL